MVDELRILRGEDICVSYVVKGMPQSIVLHQPTLTEIADMGEASFFSAFHILCSIPSDMKSVLWDVNIDFSTLSDWDYFLYISRTITSEQTGLIFGDVDFSKMEVIADAKTEEKFLVSNSLIINEEFYKAFIPYVREMIGYVLKREKAANRFTRDILIQEDRKKRMMSKNKTYESALHSTILSLVNTEEFSYTYKSVFELTIYQLMRSFTQIQGKKAACALYQGSMSGFVDTSKIKSINFQWTYSKDKYNNK